MSANNIEQSNVAENWDDQMADQSNSVTSEPQLNAQAKSFMPNIMAKAFVPSFAEPSSKVMTAQTEAPKPNDLNQAFDEKMSISNEKPQSNEPVIASKSAQQTQKEVKNVQKVPETKQDAPKEKPKNSTEPEKATPVQQTAIDSELTLDMYGKELVNLVFIGHVDAGKSTLGGNILYLTGRVDQRTLEKYQRDAKENGTESWYLSWALDSTKEERAEGKTVEVGRASFETDKRRYAILDAPGHRGYVSNMISGASQADVGILVISARKGEYETGFERGGQTREHALLAKTQGVNKLIVAVNKMDDATVNWSKERYDECLAKPLQFLKSVGYNPKKDVFCIPVSAYTGANLKDRVSPTVCPWYEGPTLLEYLDTMEAFDRKINAPFLMPISSKYKDLGTVVEGKIESGSIKKRDKIFIMPGKREAEVLSISNVQDDEVDAAVCGEQVRLKLRGVDEESVFSGDVASSVNNPVHCVTEFDAHIALIELNSIITAGFSCAMYVNTLPVEVTIKALLHKLDKNNRKSKHAPTFANKGMKVVATLVASKPICLEKFKDHPQLGRFTLRDQAITIGIGKVVKLRT